MEKIKLTSEAMQIGEFPLECASFIPYRQKMEMAEKLVRATLVLDEDGVAYKSCHYDMEDAFFFAEYYTNIDTSDWDTEDGRVQLYDFLTTPRPGPSYLDRIYNKALEDGYIVRIMYGHILAAAKAKWERTSSLSYKIGKTLESIIGDGNEDVIRQLAESREVSEKMIDMIRVFRESKTENESEA